MAIRYAESEIVWTRYDRLIIDTIERHSFRKVCDLGGGANPVLPLEFVQASGIEYTVLDLSKEELDKAPDAYTKVVHDIMSPEAPPCGPFDLILTKMLAEHVQDGELFHKKIYHMLARGGIAVHFFSTLYALPFLLNRWLPEWIGRTLLMFLAPRNPHHHDKFPARYSWCRGPTRRMQQRIESLGYEIMEYWGLYGHRGYYLRIPLMLTIHDSIVKLLLKHPAPLLTSYAYLVLRKGDTAPRDAR